MLLLLLLIMSTKQSLPTMITIINTTHAATHDTRQLQNKPLHDTQIHIIKATQHRKLTYKFVFMVVPPWARRTGTIWVKSGNSLHLAADGNDDVGRRAPPPRQHVVRSGSHVNLPVLSLGEASAVKILRIIGVNWMLELCQSSITIRFYIYYWWIRWFIVQMRSDNNFNGDHQKNMRKQHKGF